MDPKDKASARRHLACTDFESLSVVGLRPVGLQAQDSGLGNGGVATVGRLGLTK